LEPLDDATPHTATLPFGPHHHVDDRYIVSAIADRAPAPDQSASIVYEKHVCAPSEGEGELGRILMSPPHRRDEIRDGAPIHVLCRIAFDHTQYQARAGATFTVMKLSPRRRHTAQEYRAHARRPRL
jgi:hypothetical protein